MSFKIERGLFKLDFTDQYAILGVPVDADGNEIRKRYLKIARRLHPDTCKAETEAQKQLANQIFSKLVNPAYEQLHPDKARAEYKLVVGRMGQRLAGEAGKVQIYSETAKQLAKAGNNVDNVYKTSLQELAKTQYESIDKAVDAIAQMSELNMVYLIMKQGNIGGYKPIPSVGENPTQTPSGSIRRSQPVPQPPPPAKISQVEVYCRRAEEYMQKNLFAKAEIELRDAIKIEPNNSRCHSLLGMVYLKQNPPKTTMAKVYITQALKFDPKNKMALEGKQILDGLTQNATGSGKTTMPPNGGKPPQSKPSDKSGGGGLFGGMFGGSKKK